MFNFLGSLTPICILAVALYWFSISTTPNNLYLFSKTIVDMKDENRCNPDVNYLTSDLSEINVIYKKVNMDNWENFLNKFSEEHEKTRRDTITISRETLGPQFDNMMQAFSTEHLHEDAEVRFIKEGSGYFDFRSKNDEWMRMHVTRGDLLFLPAGIYHRFTTDHSDYTVAVRLFQDSPQWKAVYRSEISEQMYIRKKYLQEIGVLLASDQK